MGSMLVVVVGAFIYLSGLMAYRKEYKEAEVLALMAIALAVLSLG